MKYKIVTTCDAITEYIVEASSPEEAEEKFSNGEFESEKITDFQNENIETVSREEMCQHLDTDEKLDSVQCRDCGLELELQEDGTQRLV